MANPNRTAWFAAQGPKWDLIVMEHFSDMAKAEGFVAAKKAEGYTNVRLRRYATGPRHKTVWRYIVRVYQKPIQVNRDAL